MTPFSCNSIIFGIWSPLFSTFMSLLLHGRQVSEIRVRRGADLHPACVINIMLGGLLVRSEKQWSLLHSWIRVSNRVLCAHHQRFNDGDECCSSSHFLPLSHHPLSVSSSAQFSTHSGAGRHHNSPQRNSNQPTTARHTTKVQSVAFFRDLKLDLALVITFSQVNTHLANYNPSTWVALWNYFAECVV